MKTLHFRCHKVASKLPLDTIASFFKIHRPLGWKEYIMLDGYHLELILKYKSASKQVYLFEFGCITFVNFDEYEVGVFLEHLESTANKLDYTLFAKFHETHTVKIYDNGSCSLWKGSEKRFKDYGHITHIVSMILAKSTALYKLETDVNNLLDSAENYIQFLQKGSLRGSTKKFALMTAGFLRFQYDSINHIRIFDRSIYGNQSLLSREVYDELALYYELYERYEVVQSKIADLQGITGTYSKLSYKQSENRLYMFEIFLLSLFPLSSFLHYLADRYGTMDVFRLLFK